MSIDLSKKYQKTDKSVSFDTFLLHCWSLFQNHFGPKCIKKLTNHEIHCWECFATFDTFLSHFCLSPTKYKLWKLSKMCQKWISAFQKCIKKVTKVCLLTHFCHIFGISCPHCMDCFGFHQIFGQSPWNPFAASSALNFGTRQNLWITRGYGWSMCGWREVKGWSICG